MNFIISLSVPRELFIDNFTEEIKKYPWAMVRFYAPWCAYSQISEPAWNDFTDGFEKTVNFFNLNCNQIPGRECRDRFDVRGYPSYKLYKNGKFYDFFRATYPRQVDVFQEWLNRALTKKKETII